MSDDDIERIIATMPRKTPKPEAAPKNEPKKKAEPVGEPEPKPKQEPATKRAEPERYDGWIPRYV